MHEDNKSNTPSNETPGAASGSPPFALEIDGTPVAKVPADAMQDAVAAMGAYLWFKLKYRCAIGFLRLPEENMLELPWFTSALDVVLPDAMAAAIAAHVAAPAKRRRKTRTKKAVVHVVAAGTPSVGGRIKPWPDHVRCVPACLLRCAIFSPVGSAGTYHRKPKTLVSTAGLKVSIQGTQLLESDLDVFLGALHLARRELEGSLVRVSLVDMIAACGRSDGNRTRKHLDRALRRLQRCRVSIDDSAFGLKYEGPLLERISITGAGRQFTVTFRVPAAFYELYRRPPTYLDLLDRQICAGRPLAAWMQAFVASHRIVYPYSRKLYHGLTGLACPQFTFNRQINDALDNLKSKGIIIDHWVNKDGNVAIISRARPTKTKSAKSTGGAAT